MTPSPHTSPVASAAHPPTHSLTRPRADEDSMPFLHEQSLDFLFPSSQDTSFQPAFMSNEARRGNHSSFTPSYDATWPSHPAQSLLFTPTVGSRSYDPPPTFHPTTYRPDYSLQQPPYPMMPSSRPPEIRLDISNIDLSPPMHLSSGYPRTPFDQTPSPVSFNGYTPSGASSGSSLPPSTPSMSPLGMPGGPLYVNPSPTSPFSRSSNPFESKPLNPTMRANSTFRSVLEIATVCTLPTDGPLIPQKMYRPHTQSDRRRYVEEVELEEPIMFYMENPASCGITLCDALNSKFMHLVGRDDLMFVNNGPSVSIRLMWPGYAPWTRQIPTRDFRSPPGPITRSKLAKNVAKTVQRFIDDMQKHRMEEDADQRWRVGSQYIKLDHLVLVGLQHVSKGSWQAYVRLRHA